MSKWPTIWLRVLAPVVCVLLVLGAALTAAIIFGTAPPPRPVLARQLDLTGLPALNHFTARDGTRLAYRAYPGGDRQVAVLIHGTGTESSVMNALAKTLNAGARRFSRPICAAMVVPAAAATSTTSVSSMTILQI